MGLVSKICPREKNRRLRSPVHCCSLGFKALSTCLNYFYLKNTTPNQGGGHFVGLPISLQKWKRTPELHFSFFIEHLSTEKCRRRYNREWAVKRLSVCYLMLPAYHEPASLRPNQKNDYACISSSDSSTACSPWNAFVMC